MYSSTSKPSNCLQYHSHATDFLQLPHPASGNYSQKSAGILLTSRKNLQNIEKKEQAKLEKEALKLKRQRERTERKQAKLDMERKKLEHERKRLINKENKKPSRAKKVHVTAFSEEEELLFQRRFENGYDLKHDSRYNRWIEIYHPESQSPKFPMRKGTVYTVHVYSPCVLYM